jgi:hypothetical protein
LQRLPDERGPGSSRYGCRLPLPCVNESTCLRLTKESGWTPRQYTAGLANTLKNHLRTGGSRK